MVAVVVLLALGGYGVYSATGASGPVIPNVFADNVAGGDLAKSYAVLRALGLNVQIAFVDTNTLHVSSSSEGYASVAHMWPAPGTPFRHGDVVTLVAESTGMASWIAVTKSNPRYRVPDFVGRTAETAIAWAGKRRLQWDIPSLPPLMDSRPKQLYAAYRVIAQKPEPGAAMRQIHHYPSGGVNYSYLTLTVVPVR